MNVQPTRGTARSLASVMDDYPSFARVACDASFRDGFAGLGIAGSLRRHGKCVPAENNQHAEMLALLWALMIAEERCTERVVFMLDCRNVVDWARGVPRRAPSVRTEPVLERMCRLACAETITRNAGWFVVYVSRVVVAAAHIAAGQERRAFERRGLLPTELRR